MIDLHALLMNNFKHKVFSIESTAVHRCARKITEFASGIDVLSDTGCCAERVLLLNIPFVHVCVDRHPLSSAVQRFRAQGSAHRTYQVLLLYILDNSTCINIYMLCNKWCCDM